MKKIAIVLNTTWNIYNFRLNLMKYLKKTGYEVEAIFIPKVNSVLVHNYGIHYDSLLINKSFKPSSPVKQVISLYISLLFEGHTLQMFLNL